MLPASSYCEPTTRTWTHRRLYLGLSIDTTVMHKAEVLIEACEIREMLEDEQH